MPRIALTESEREDMVLGSLRFLSGDEDAEAEDAYFTVSELSSRDPETAWQIIAEIATRSRDVADAGAIGAGLLESFIILNGTSHAEMIADGIVGNARLIESLRSVRGLGRHPALLALLPIGLDP